MKFRCFSSSFPALFAAVLCCFFLAGARSADAQRLSQNVRPEHYALTLTPDLKAATFSGVETIGVTLAEAANSITLNSAGDRVQT